MHSSVGSAVMPVVHDVVARAGAVGRLLLDRADVAGSMVFVRRFISEPRRIGAVWPSSASLARTMAAYVPSLPSGLVVELGAGTGAVTCALVAREDVRPRLCVIEREPRFVHALRARFPSVTVIEGNAERLGALLGDTRAAAIVSSLPLRSLSPSVVERILAEWRRCLLPGGVIIQFTYALGDALPPALQSFRAVASHVVVANLPPARVWVLASRAASVAPMGGDFPYARAA